MSKYTLEELNTFLIKKIAEAEKKAKFWATQKGEKNTVKELQVEIDMLKDICSRIN